MTTPEARGGRAFAAAPVVEIPDPLEDAWADQVVSCDVEQSAGLPDTAVLTIRDSGHRFLSATGVTIGTPVAISARTVQDSVRTRLFNGEVTALELDVDGTGTFTLVRAAAKIHRLMRGRRVKAFRNMTISDIVREIARDAGVACGGIGRFPVVHRQLSQPNVSDWDFLTYLAQESGARLGVDENGLLEFLTPKPADGAPAPSTPATSNPLVLEYGRNLQELHAVLTGADGAGTVEVRGWDVTTKSVLIASAPSVRSQTVRPGIRPAVANAAFGAAARRTVADTPYRTHAETRAAARAVAASVSAGFAELEAVVEGNPALRVGTPVALGNVGPAFSGRYTANLVRHVLEPQRGYRTTVVVSASADRSLAGLTGGDGRLPPAGARMPGLAVAVVTDVREPDDGQRGWVRLRFPWLDDEYVSGWARTVQGGGHGGGGVFSPEVNDEVLVGFEQGSLDSPYVIGGLYNGRDAPSPHDVPLVDPTSGKVNRRSLVDRSGNRLELLDTASGPSGVRLATGDGRMEVRLDERGEEIVLSLSDPVGAEPRFVRVATDGITLDAGTGHVEVKGASVTVRATTGVTVDGGEVGVFKAGVIRLN